MRLTHSCSHVSNTSYQEYLGQLPLLGVTSNEI